MNNQPKPKPKNNRKNDLYFPQKKDKPNKKEDDFQATQLHLKPKTNKILDYYPQKTN